MLTGELFKNGIIAAAVCIKNNRTKIDELNVYPVPDGDTGTNMSLTLSAAARELEMKDDNITVSQAADIAAGAMLRGARGNSGVITSILFRGYSKAFKGLSEASSSDIAKALKEGADAAYRSVMNPTEGTVLTVARIAAQRAESISAEKNMLVFWEKVCDAAQKALDKTPEQLPVLKKAGVVDAGGQGLVMIYKAMLNIFKGEAMPELEENKPKKTTIEPEIKDDHDGDIKYSYCTEYIVEKASGCKDAFMLRAYLETIGDCVVVVEDSEIIKVHVHTDSPGLALQKGLEFGRFINEPKPKIENMRIQHEMRLRDKKFSEVKFTPAKPENEYGFVAVAAGGGIEDMFRDLGADCIVKGGQTMNPSTDDILKAILSTPAKTVFVIPNNKNIIMAAEQAVNLADRNVCVIPTRSIPQGIAAMMAFDDTQTFDENRLEMTRAIEGVATGLVTYAARDSDYEGVNIKKGDVLAFNDGKLQLNDKDINKAAYRLVKKMAKGDSSLITVMYGCDVSASKAEELKSQLEAKFDGKAEIMLLNGGQPVYYYIISAE